MVTDTQSDRVVRLGGPSAAALAVAAFVLLVPIGLVLGTSFAPGVPDRVRILAVVISVVFGLVIVARTVLPLVRETPAVVDLDAGTIAFGRHDPVPFARLGYAQLLPRRRSVGVQLGLDRRTFVTVTNAPLAGSTRAQRAAALAVIEGSALPGGDDAVHPLRDRARILATLERFF